jgi:predicted metal-dependent phosphoesterase TrpH
LHCHTTASDGGLSPEQLIDRAAALNLEVLAVTDHDTTDGVPVAQAEGQRRGITVVPGVEISTVSQKEEIHILGYFVDLDDPDLQALLAHTRQTRRERAEKMLARLENLGLSITWDRLLEISGGPECIGRPHVAASLMEAGYVRSWDEAFDLWIGRGRPAYVERYKLLPEQAIQLVRKSGGLPVLAHPYFYSREGACKASLDLKRWLPRLRQAGLVGIEIYYPNYPHRASRTLLEMALQHSLLITGGSDFHGGVAANGLGSVAVPWAAWEGLDRRRRQMRVRAAERSQRDVLRENV